MRQYTDAFQWDFLIESLKMALSAMNKTSRARREILKIEKSLGGAAIDSIDVVIRDPILRILMPGKYGLTRRWRCLQRLQRLQRCLRHNTTTYSWRTIADSNKLFMRHEGGSLVTAKLPPNLVWLISNNLVVAGGVVSRNVVRRQ